MKDTRYQGLSGRHLYYSELENPESPDDAAWGRHLEHLKAWLKARPDSPTPYIALGSAWSSLAWSARGGGYANTVSADSWKLFNSRVETAQLLRIRRRQEAGRSRGLHAINRTGERPGLVA